MTPDDAQDNAFLFCLLECLLWQSIHVYFPRLSGNFSLLLLKPMIYHPLLFRERINTFHFKNAEILSEHVVLMIR